MLLASFISVLSPVVEYFPFLSFLVLKATGYDATYIFDAYSYIARAVPQQGTALVWLQICSAASCFDAYAYVACSWWHPDEYLHAKTLS